MTMKMASRRSQRATSTCTVVSTFRGAPPHVSEGSAAPLLCANVDERMENEKAAHINLLFADVSIRAFELAVTLKLSHYSVPTFSTRVNAVCVTNAWFSHIPVLAFMAAPI